MTDSYRYYAQGVVRRGELYVEIERVRRLLVHHESNPLPIRADHAKNIQTLTAMFKALLLAKESRQEVVQNICKDNRGDTKNSRSSPAHDPGSSVSIWDVLEEEVSGS